MRKARSSMFEVSRTDFDALTEQVKRLEQQVRDVEASLQFLELVIEKASERQTTDLVNLRSRVFDLERDK